ncbi:MAG: helicase C-terminal domain-containing protein [Anaerolineae bacterium]|jgi:hypothetical protein|nr:helicase C-terminal domain-containing protein [Anaerolineae bacterium]
MSELTFREKSDLNRRLMDILTLRLVDKETPIIEWPGKRYYHDEPANRSLMGSIGHQPDPDFTGPQPPNAMGMVILVTPDDNGTIHLRLSGQFDVTHRCIPELDVMRKELKRDGHNIKPNQPVVTAYRRMTVTFEQVDLVLNLPADTNQWVRSGSDTTLNQTLNSLRNRCLDDPEIFKRCYTGPTGGALVDFAWNDDQITEQADLNNAVAAALFDDTSQVLEYRIQLRARARRTPLSMTGGENAYLVEVFLENNTTREDARRFGIARNAHLLDARFSCELVKGNAQDLPHKLAPADYRHRDNSTVAGYGVTTSVRRDAQGIFHTEAMPVSYQAKTKNPSSESLGLPYDPTFEQLARDPIPLLRSFVVAVHHYASEWDEVIARLRHDGDAEAAQVASGEQAVLRQEADTIADGIDLLEKHTQLRQAFTWMNEAMRDAFAHQGKAIHQWRLFQLGFILTQIRAVYERSCPKEEITDHLNTAEVLWFATGGGKTEAYLGIVVMSMLYERLQQRLYGVTAWMKFPLRMLSVQQFQRLSYVVAQANRIKKRENLPGHPYTIGYFTGEGTANFITRSGDAYRRHFLPTLSKEQLYQYQFISDCPYCDEKNSVSVQKDLARCRLTHVCSNPECWTHREAPAGQYGEGIRGEIGIYVSDEEVYRYIPTVLVGTIDKLAVIGHNRRFRLLLGGATHFCPEHGFSLEGKCQHNRLEQKDNGSYLSTVCGNNTRTSGIKTQPLGGASQPGIQFILQDELHLLSQNTGNFDAHYESTMQALQTANGGRPPKILSATATIKGYEDHINHLYQRKARRFPVPGIRRGESFYSRIDSDDQGELVQRWYAGILPLGSGRIVERASAIASSRFLTLVDDLRTALVASPDSACVTLGLPSSKAHAALEHIGTYLNSCLIYNNSIRGNGELHGALEEYQMPEYPERRWKKLDGSTPLDDIQKAIQLIETKTVDDPTRQMIATSVVSHGVDMHRLNFMIVSGWPKSIAEYIQSSARSGRVEPGIVLSIMDSRQLFQTNVYLDFLDYHRFMERMVESVPINRFAPNLLERTLPGMISACVLNWMEGQSWGQGASKNAGKLRDILVSPTSGAERSLRDLLTQCLSVPVSIRDRFDHRVIHDYHEALDRRINHALRGLVNLSSNLATEYLSDALARLLGHAPMRSLRDIESQILIKPEGDTDSLIEALGRRR